MPKPGRLGKPLLSHTEGALKTDAFSIIPRIVRGTERPWGRSYQFSLRWRYKHV